MKNQTQAQIISIIVMSFFVQSLLPAQVYSFRMQEGKKHLEYYLDRASSESDFAQFEKIAQEGFLSSMAAWENENISLMDLKNYNKEKENTEYNKLIEVLKNKFEQ